MRKLFLLLLPAVLCITMLTLAGCDGENTSTDVNTNSPNNSIVSYLSDDVACQKLVEDMEAGKLPISCEVLYDQMGSRPSVTVTDSETITQLYELFAQITVTQKTNESITDSYHLVVFYLQDGTISAFYFEGDIWCYGTGIEDRVKVENAGPFWAKVRELQDEQLQ